MHAHLLCLMEFVHFWHSDPLSFLWVLNTSPLISLISIMTECSSQAALSQSVWYWEGGGHICENIPEMCMESPCWSRNSWQEWSLWGAPAGADSPKVCARAQFPPIVEQMAEPELGESIKSGREELYELTPNPLSLPHASCTVQSGAEEEKSGMKEWSERWRRIPPGSGEKIKGQGSCFVSHYPNFNWQQIGFPQVQPASPLTIIAGWSCCP